MDPHVIKEFWFDKIEILERYKGKEEERYKLHKILIKIVNKTSSHKIKFVQQILPKSIAVDFDHWPASVD